MKDFDADIAPPMSRTYKSVAEKLNWVRKTWFGPAAQQLRSSARARGIAPMALIHSAHGRNKKATIVIEKGHTCGMLRALLYGTPRPPAIAFRTERESINL